MLRFQAYLVVIQMIMISFGILYGFLKSKHHKDGHVITSGIKTFFFIALIIAIISYFVNLFTDLDCQPVLECSVTKGLSLFAYFPLIITFLIFTGFGVFVGIILRRMIKKK